MQIPVNFGKIPLFIFFFDRKKSDFFILCGQIPQYAVDSRIFSCYNRVEKAEINQRRNKMKYGGTVLSVADVNQSRKFYEELFGLEVYQDYGINVSFTQ